MKKEGDGFKIEGDIKELQRAIRAKKLRIFDVKNIMITGPNGEKFPAEKIGEHVRVRGNCSRCGWESFEPCVGVIFLSTQFVPKTGGLKILSSESLMVTLKGYCPYCQNIVPTEAGLPDNSSNKIEFEWMSE